MAGESAGVQKVQTRIKMKTTRGGRGWCWQYLRFNFLIISVLLFICLVLNCHYCKYVSQVFNKGGIFYSKNNDLIVKLLLLHFEVSEILFKTFFPCD